MNGVENVESDDVVFRGGRAKISSSVPGSPDNAESRAIQLLVNFSFRKFQFFSRRFPSILKIFKNYEFCGLMTFCKLQCIFLESDGDDKKEEPEVLEELLNELRKLLVSTLVEQHLQSLIQNRQIVWRQSCCLFVASSTTLNKKLASFNMRLSC